MLPPLRSPALLTTALVAIVAAQTCSLMNNMTTPALNITALDGIDGRSTIECWQLEPFSISSTPGTVGALAMSLGDTGKSQYIIIPGRYNAGIHNAGARQFVFFASGVIRLSIPNTTEEAWVQGGKYGLIYAQDTANVSATGHLTEYVSEEATIAMVVPLAPDAELKHRVLHSGGCTWAEMAGL